MNTPPLIEGLQSALSFTRLVTTLSVAGFAYMITQHIELVDLQVRDSATWALGLLLASVIGGIFVEMRGATMLSEGDYNLSDGHLLVPGLINVITFVLGFVCTGLALAGI
ncbi:MAG: hypothetical protein KI785_01665 [Devosiaceae bacterium]|nr:hypothetical protein [Devosiaceae bacterium MH13]